MNARLLERYAEAVESPTAQVSPEQLADIHEAVGAAVVEEARLNPSKAELLLRNTAVLFDRLSPSQFEMMSPDLKDRARALASLARTEFGFGALDIGPEGETAHEAAYRKEVWQPFHLLQARAHGCMASSLPGMKSLCAT